MLSEVFFVSTEQAQYVIDEVEYHDIVVKCNGILFFCPRAIGSLQTSTLSVLLLPFKYWDCWIFLPIRCIVRWPFRESLPHMVDWDG